MEPARKDLATEPSAAAARAERFLAEVVAQTRVSARFAEAARPAIEKAFSDVDAALRDALLERIRELFLTQAATESSCRGAVDALGRMERSHVAMHENLAAAHRQMADLRDRLVGTAFAACRFSDETTPPRVRA